MSQREIKDQLQKLLKISKAELGELLTQSAEAGYRFDLSRLPTTDRIPFEQNSVVQNIVSAAVKLAQDDLANITQTLGIVDPYGRALPLQQACRSCMDYAFMQASTGAVLYIDYESGVHTSLKAAVRRSIMGGMG